MSQRKSLSYNDDAFLDLLGQNKYIVNYFTKYLFIFRQRGREGEREGEKHQCAVAFGAPPTGDLARNLGMCPDWESNSRPIGLQASAQSTKPENQPGLIFVYFKAGADAAALCGSLQISP